MTATLPESNPRSVRRPVPRRYREASRRARRRRVPSAPRLPVPLAAVAAAGWAVGVTLLACAAVTVLAWTAGGHGDAGFDDALRAGGLAYLVANLAPVTLPAGTFSLLPLGLTAVPLLLTHRAGRWAVRRTGCSTPAVVARLTVAAVLLYAAATAVVAATVDLGGVHVNPVLAFLTAASVALVGLGSGTVTAAGLWRPLRARVPVPLRRAGVAAAASTAALGAGAALLLALALVLRVGHVRDLATQVAPGVSGAVVLALLGVLYLPTLVVWSLAYAAGPGFVLGGAVTGPFDAGGGLAPAFPALAAVPAVPPPGAVALLLLPVLAGVVGGAVLLRRRDGGRLLVEVLLTGALTGLAVVAAGLLASGSLGDGRLAHVGPNPWLLGVVCAALVLLGATAAVGLGAVLARGPFRAGWARLRPLLHHDGSG